MKRSRFTKIVATLGPSSNKKSVIEKLFKTGVDVFRLNFSHGTHADHLRIYKLIREVEKQMQRPIGVFADLQGPKLRIGKFKDDKVTLKKGQRFYLDTSEDLGDENRVNFPHESIYSCIKKGTKLILDDGRIRLEVLTRKGYQIEAKVLIGGILSNNKGVNIPNAVLPLSPITDKDQKDLNFAVSMGVDWIALSFVQKPSDVALAKKLIGQKCRLISKIEKPSAVEHIEDIIDLSDAVMLARGDLGVELPPEKVPVLQKRIIRDCRKAGKPIIVATQMLESMVHAPIPTRAEASDVATAVFDGTDAVMLSAETAAGSYPIEAVNFMNRIIETTESDPLYQKIQNKKHLPMEETAADAITSAAANVAETLSISAIVTFTSSGSTSIRASRERPSVPILGLTENPTTARYLTLSWGVHAVLTEDVKDFTDMVTKACKIAKDEAFAKTGQPIVITAGVPFGTPGATNILRIAWI